MQIDAAFIQLTTAQPHNCNLTNCRGPETAKGPWVYTEQLFYASSGV